MKELFQFIKARINEKIPAIKHVEMWRGQSTRERIDKNENPFRTPAVFIEFIVEDIQNFSLGIKNVNLIVRFRFALQNMRFERLEDLDFQDNFDFFIQNLRGNETDPVHFGTLQEAVTELDAEFDNVNEPAVSYKTVWRKTSAFRRKIDNASYTNFLYNESEDQGAAFLFNEDEDETPKYSFNEDEELTLTVTGEQL